MDFETDDADRITLSMLNEMRLQALQDLTEPEEQDTTTASALRTPLSDASRLASDHVWPVLSDPIEPAASDPWSQEIAQPSKEEHIPSPWPHTTERIWNRQEDPSQRVEPGTVQFISDKNNIRFVIKNLLRDRDGTSDEDKIIREPLTFYYPRRHITIFWTPAGVSGTYTGKRTPSIKKFFGMKGAHYQHWGLVIQQNNFIQMDGLCVELDTAVEGKQMVIFPKARSWYVRLAEAVRDVGAERASTIFQFYRTGIWTEKSNQEIFDIAKLTCEELGGTYNLFSSNCQHFANRVITGIQMDRRLVHSQPRWAHMRTLGSVFPSSEGSLEQDDAERLKLQSDVDFGQPMIATEHNDRVDKFMAQLKDGELDDIPHSTGVPRWMTAVLNKGSLD